MKRKITIHGCYLAIFQVNYITHRPVTLVDFYSFHQKTSLFSLTTKISTFNFVIFLQRQGFQLVVNRFSKSYVQSTVSWDGVFISLFKFADRLNGIICRQNDEFRMEIKKTFLSSIPDIFINLIQIILSLEATFIDLSK